MEPTIRPGDRVRVVACRRLLPGDVAVFETAAGDALVMHRVVFKIPGTAWFFHVGDNGREDAPGLVHTDRVIGRAALPRRLPPPRVWLASLRRMVGAATRRRCTGITGDGIHGVVARWSRLT